MRVWCAEGSETDGGMLRGERGRERERKRGWCVGEGGGGEQNSGEHR